MVATFIATLDHRLRCTTRWHRYGDALQDSYKNAFRKREFQRPLIIYIIIQHQSRAGLCPFRGCENPSGLYPEP